MFREEFVAIRAKVATRAYTSVTPFSTDLVRVFSSDLGVHAENTAEFQAQVDGRAVNMTFEQKEKRKLAKRIVKMIQPALEDALRNESELNGRPYAQQMKEMDEMLFSRRASLADSVDLDLQGSALLVNGNGHTSANKDEDAEMAGRPNEPTTNGHMRGGGHDDAVQDTSMVDAADDGEEVVAASSIAQLNGELTADTELLLAAHTPPASTNGVKKEGEKHVKRSAKKGSPAHEPPTPPISLEGNQQAGLPEGGIPWYVEQFDPNGTTIYEERWTGPEVLRGMSEELSEMDDAELQDLGDFAEGPPSAGGPVTAVPTGRFKMVKKNGKRKRRWTGFK